MLLAVGRARCGQCRRSVLFCIYPKAWRCIVTASSGRLHQATICFLAISFYLFSSSSFSFFLCSQHRSGRGQRRGSAQKVRFSAWQTSKETERVCGREERSSACMCAPRCLSKARGGQDACMYRHVRPWHRSISSMVCVRLFMKKNKRKGAISSMVQYAAKTFSKIKSS